MRSISTANYTIVRHEFSIPALRSLANGRWARGLRRNTSAYRAAIERLLAAEMRSKPTVADDPETAVARIIELVKTCIPRRFGLDPIRDVQVLCPMNRGGFGARSVNIELQAALNPAGDRKVERFGWIFTRGDKVMQIENDYDKEVYSGDIGFVADVEPEEGELTASFDGRLVS